MVLDVRKLVVELITRALGSAIVAMTLDHRTVGDASFEHHPRHHRFERLKLRGGRRDAGEVAHQRNTDVAGVVATRVCTHAPHARERAGAGTHATLVDVQAGCVLAHHHLVADVTPTVIRAEDVVVRHRSNIGVAVRGVGGRVVNRHRNRRVLAGRPVETIRIPTVAVVGVQLIPHVIGRREVRHARPGRNRRIVASDDRVLHVCRVAPVGHATALRDEARAPHAAVGRHQTLPAQRGSICTLVRRSVGVRVGVASVSGIRVGVLRIGVRVRVGITRVGRHTSVSGKGLRAHVVPIVAGEQQNERHYDLQGGCTLLRGC